MSSPPLRSLVLKGHRFETVVELSSALMAALSYWNEHRHPYHWKKQPQDQPTILLGGFHPELTRKTVAT